MLDAMTAPQRTSLTRELTRNPGVDRADLLDAHHLVRVVTKNFDRAFEDVYRNFKQTQSWLLQVGETRNVWAHPRTGDMLADEVGHALLTLYHLISSPTEALKVPGVQEALDDARIPDNARVLVFDGQEAAGARPSVTA